MFNVLRLVLCFGALYFVVRGVTYYDRIERADGSDAIVGLVRGVGAEVVIERPGGALEAWSLDEIAKDPDGEPRIRYGLRTTWVGSNKWFLALAVLLHFPVLFPQALRFRIMLAAQGIVLGYVECLKLSLAGNFLNFAAPLGSNAGDVFKAYFATLHAPDRKPEAVATVILDRAIGLGSLLLVVVLITLVAPAAGKLGELRPYLLTMFLIGVAIVIAYFSPFLRRRFFPDWLRRRLPMYDELRRLDGAARRLLGQWPVVVVAVLLTVFLQALAMLAYYAVAMGVGLEADIGLLPEFFAYFYTGTVVQALPGPPQGLGTVELTYRYFFSSFGSPAQIVSMALAIRVVVLVCALPGIWVTITGSYRPKDALSLQDVSASGAAPPTAPAPVTEVAPHHECRGDAAPTSTRS